METSLQVDLNVAVDVYVLVAPETRWTLNLSFSSPVALPSSHFLHHSHLPQPFFPSHPIILPLYTSYYYILPLARVST